MTDKYAKPAANLADSIQHQVDYAFDNPTTSQGALRALQQETQQLFNNPQFIKDLKNDLAKKETAGLTSVFIHSEENNDGEAKDPAELEILAQTQHGSKYKSLVVVGANDGQNDPGLGGGGPYHKNEVAVLAGAGPKEPTLEYITARPVSDQASHPVPRYGTGGHFLLDT